MKLPEDVKKILDRRFQNKCCEWLTDKAEQINAQNQWPLEIPLGIPTEQAALRQVEGVRAWVVQWQHWQKEQAVGKLSWCERRWKALGVQRLPEKLELSSPEEVAMLLGESERWLRAKSRYDTLISRWPALVQQLTRHYHILANYSDVDFFRLVNMLNWISLNPRSNLYPRQIPVAGADSKWLESRRGLLSDLVAAIQGDPIGDRDFYELCGLKSQPQLMRMRVLDPVLRARLGGLADVSVPCDELANVAIRPKNVFIVENLQTGLAFDDLPGAIVIMRLGYAVDSLGRIPWLNQAQCVYWGDIDTHGFAILNRARTYIPTLKSVLMDESTLMDHRDLWVQEKAQHPSAELSKLTIAEQNLYQALRGNAYGQQVRLEQERIRWDEAWNVVQGILSTADHYP